MDATHVKVLGVETFSQSLAMPFVLRQYAELIDKGFAHSHWPISNDHRCVYCLDSLEDKVVGAAVYDINKTSKGGWITLIAVDPAYQRLGLYRRMYEMVVANIMRAGANKIAFHSHVNNLPINVAAERSGMKREFVRWTRNLS